MKKISIWTGAPVRGGAISLGDYIKATEISARRRGWSLERAPFLGAAQRIADRAVPIGSDERVVQAHP